MGDSNTSTAGHNKIKGDKIILSPFVITID